MAPIRMSRVGLLPRVCIAIVLGIVCGQFFPQGLARLFVTFNMIFSQFLSFAIPLIIVGLVTPAIAELGKGAGRWLGVTAAIAYGSTIFAGLLAFVTCVLVFPSILNYGGAPSVGNPEDGFLAPAFTLEIPPVFGVMTALVLSFCLGVGLTLIQGDTLRRAFVDLRSVVEWMIAAILIPLLPLYIFGMFLDLTMNGQIAIVISTFARVILVAFAIMVVLLLLQYAIAGAMFGRNPLELLKGMAPAYVTALGTSSSAATIPVTLRCVVRNGVPGPIASFVVPLCATIHLAGSTIKIVTFSLAIMTITGMPLHVGTYVGFILMLGVTMVAAPGVPGGAIMAAIGILQSMLGFDDTAIGLMIAMYIAVDSLGTACNVTGDGAIACVVSRLSRGRLEGRAAPTTSPVPEFAGTAAAGSEPAS
ncbi:MAG: dicarboxylate/amino acid:cation symporter [Dermatophilaceae bacterium]